MSFGLFAVRPAAASYLVTTFGCTNYLQASFAYLCRIVSLNYPNSAQVEHGLFRNEKLSPSLGQQPQAEEGHHG